MRCMICMILYNCDAIMSSMFYDSLIIFLWENQLNRCWSAGTFQKVITLNNYQSSPPSRDCQEFFSIRKSPCVCIILHCIFHEKPFT